ATVLGAVVTAFAKRDEQELDDDARQELLEARDALLDEFVELERAHKRGDIGPKTYGRVRTALLDALSRIMGKIEGASGPERQPGRRKAEAPLKKRRSSTAAPRPSSGES